MKDTVKSHGNEAQVLQYARMSEEELLSLLGTGREGLTPEKADELLEKHGPNEISHNKGRPLYLRFVFAFINPFSIVLFVVAMVSFFTEVVVTHEKSWATVIIILALIVVSGLMQFIQEFKSDKAAEKLQDMVSSVADVIRGGASIEIPMKDIVPGDIVKLSSGDMLPADLRILSAKDLFIGQAALTGESEPVEKFSTPPAETATALETPNVCYMGTNVVSGSALGVAIETGDATYLGSIAKSLSSRTAQSSFEKGVASVSRLLLRLMLVMVPIIFVINGISKHDWIGALLFSMSVAVGLAPELLPMIMTSTLAKGAVAMAKRKTIVKNLASIQSFGAMDVLCTDKTGTLTEDRIVLERYLDIHGREDLCVLRQAYLNSFFQTGLKNLIDLAIITRADTDGDAEWKHQFTKIDEIPFDFVRRRMSVVLRDEDGKSQLITKGAVEEMLECCSFAEDDGQVVALTDDLRREVLRLADAQNEEGLRVLAIAQKDDVRGEGAFSVDDERDMILVGFVGFLDPPKESSREAIAALHDHGVRVIVLTGDNEKVAATVCKKLGLETGGWLLGSEVEKLADGELQEKAQSVNLMAKLAPAQKARVVRLLQDAGHVVGYMGDGINDAPALHQADVGISVDSGVDIAKESADIILLEKSLMVLEEGVVEGRRTFGNLVKYIKMASSGNFGNMFSVLVASVFLPFLPILPLQILVQNLLYDFSQITIPFDRMDPEYLARPQKWDPGSIKSFMYWFGPVSSIFDILSFVVLYYIFKANSEATQSTFQTGWFMVGLLTQTLIVHLIRTARIPFLESMAARSLVISTVVVSAIGLILPYTRIGTWLGMVAMPLAFLPFLLGIMAAYAGAVQVMKHYYIKRYNHWI